MGSTSKLIEQYADQSHATMVRPGEPGERILVSGQIVDRDDGNPIPNVLIELVQTDNNGHYFNEKTAWNPRIFAYVKTDNYGRFKINTILPGRYQDDTGELAYSHIHFAIHHQGFAPYNSEFTFEDDPVLIKNGNPDSVPVAKLKKTARAKQYHVVIGLQGN